MLHVSCDWSILFCDSGWLVLFQASVIQAKNAAAQSMFNSLYPQKKKKKKKPNKTQKQIRHEQVISLSVMAGHFHDLENCDIVLCMEAMRYIIYGSNC